MTDGSSRRLSPWVLEKKYLQVEKRIVGQLNLLSGVFPFIIALVVASLLFFAAATFTMRLPFQMPYSSATARVTVHAILIALLLSPLSLLSNERFRVPTAMLVLISMWMGIDLNFLYANFSGLNFLIVLITRPLTIFSGYFYLRWSHGRARKWRGTLAYGTVYLLSWVPLFLASSISSYKVLVVYWALPTSAFSLFILATAFRTDLTKDEIPIALSPFNMIRGVFWPAGSQMAGATERRELWWRGIFNFAIGAFCLTLRGQVSYEEVSTSQHIAATSTLYYFGGIMTDIAICNLLVGLTRMHGYRVRDATNFVLLSVTPGEFWMRVSVYNYIFVLHNVFMPIMRRSRTRFLTTLVSFTFFFFNRFGKNWSEALLASSAAVTRGELIFGFARFVFWFLLLYISRRIWVFQKRRYTHASYAWLSIFLTHASMIFCSVLAKMVEQLFA